MSGLEVVTLAVSFNMNETEIPCDAVAVVEVPPRRVLNMQLPCICAADLCLFTNQIILTRLFLITPGG